MDLNQKISEGVTVADYLGAASQSAGTYTGSWVSAQIHRRMMAVIATGVLGASATVDAKIQQAQDSSGTGAKDVLNRAGTTLAIAQIVKASGDNKIGLINLNVDNDLDATNGFSFVRVSITVGVSASIVGMTLLGEPGYESADAYNAAAVVQIVG